VRGFGVVVLGWFGHEVVAEGVPTGGGSAACSEMLWDAATQAASLGSLHKDVEGCVQCCVHWQKGSAERGATRTQTAMMAGLGAMQGTASRVATERLQG
jgi:hypothetical protein